MKFKTISNFNVKGKIILLRADINSEIIKGNVILSDRIRMASLTIKELKAKKAKVVVIAHQGRPGSEDFTNLNQHAKLINKFTKIKFINDIIGEKAIKSIKNMREGEAILLDNLRFLKEELNPKNDNKLLNILSKVCDIYINDAFSVCHRNQTSITGFPQIMKSGIGKVMENELKNLNKIKNNSLLILGGYKVEDIVLLLGKNRILSTGVFSLLCLSAKDYKLGLEDKLLKNQRYLIKKIKSNIKDIVTPLDLAFDINGKRVNIDIKDLPTNYKALDIGNKTIKYYNSEIKKAKSIFWKGTAGYCEKEEFCLGTKQLLKTIVDSKKFCVVAGGNSSEALERFGLNKKISYVSLSGGALIYYIAGKKLPGIEALKRGIK